MAYSSTGRHQRPVIAAAIQRNLQSQLGGGINNTNRILRRYVRVIINVLCITILYTAFVYTHGVCVRVSSLQLWMSQSLACTQYDLGVQTFGLKLQYQPHSVCVSH